MTKKLSTDCCGCGQTTDEHVPQSDRTDSHHTRIVMSNQTIDPVCGMTVNPADAAGSYQYGGRPYYFCNPSCLHRFKTDPERYLKPATTTTPHIDPICGMTVDPEHAAGALKHHGQTYYFCSDSCARTFTAEPDRYIQKSSPGPSD